MMVLIGATFRRQSPQTQFAAAPAASAPHATAFRKRCFVAAGATPSRASASGGRGTKSRRQGSRRLTLAILSIDLSNDAIAPTPLASASATR
jgi:hypothetical protein